MPKPDLIFKCDCGNITRVDGDMFVNDNKAWAFCGTKDFGCRRLLYYRDQDVDISSVIQDDISLEDIVE